MSNFPAERLATSRTTLETAVSLAHHASDEERVSMHGACLSAAKLLELGFDDPLHDSIARLIRPRKAPAPEPAAAKLLDEPPATLFELENRATLDQTVRALARELDVDYTTALDRLQDSVKVGRERFKARQDVLGDILLGAGVKSLEAFEADTKLLERRDAQVAKTLEDAQAHLDGYEVDGQGRVKL